MEADKTELGYEVSVINVTVKNEILKQFVLAALGLILISWLLLVSVGSVRSTCDIYIYI